MAKSGKKRASKKGQNKKKEAKLERPKHEVPVGFWRQAFFYFLLPLLSILLILGAVNIGGSLPVWLFDIVRSAVGIVAYISPIVLLLIVRRTLKSDNKRMPFAQSLGFFALLIATSGFFHALLIDADSSLEQADKGEGGGIIGHIVIGALGAVVANYVAALILFVVAVIAMLYILRIPIESVFKAFGRLFGRKPKQDAAASLEVNGQSMKPVALPERPEFKLNEGVPLQRRSTLKNTAQKLTESEDHNALTRAADPTWKLPVPDILNKVQDQADAGDVKGNAKIIEDTLADFGIKVEMHGANIGPRVTQFTLKPPNGVRLTKITSLENNLALNLAAQSIRIEAPIPGKRLVGIEVPNRKSATVRLHGIMSSREWKSASTPLSFAIGKDIAGDAVIGELDKMPHLLVAGATGSGKSVMVNTFLSSLLYRNSPSDLKLILVDPKQVELTPYNDIPHLLTPVIVEPEKCISALKWAVAEMERRYGALAENGKRNIAEYNKLSKEESMPYIVIVIDELADLMMIAARDVEGLIVRLAQKARAVGIHLVLATQRPSVDVITGLIKANIPARIAFTVTSQVDSRTILDQGGAEKLLGMGDMLLTTPSLPKPKRVQGVFIDDDEVTQITDHVRMQRPPEYDDEIITQPVQVGGRGGVVADLDTGSDDSMYNDAIQVVIDSGKASASLLQRRLRVGYARAARLVETMEEQGIVGPADGARPREVLISSLDDLKPSGDDYQPDPNER
jgi:S-DNA-T family DNA segregation ATPase FtsK/SpoIIIE